MKHGPEKLKKIATAMKARRDRFIAEGLCSYCGETREDSAYTMCLGCRERERTRRADLKARDPNDYNMKRRADRQRIKRRVFEAYGGCKCACCGETHMEFLSIDHIDGKGAEHRRMLTGSRSNGSTVYGWLIRNNFPSGFRVLCFNCNFALGHFGYCPHQKDKQ